jgi:hypothetical protein
MALPSHSETLIAYNSGNMKDSEEVVAEQQQPADEVDYFTIGFDFRKIIISLFVVWQVFAVTVWLMPEGQGPRLYLGPIVNSYMLFTGAWQQWTMFSPSPEKKDASIEARVDYADGTHGYWNFYRMTSMGYVERYQRERFRKMGENAEPPSARRMWPYLARYAAIVCDRHKPGTYPMTVHLLRRLRYITPPPGSILPYQSYPFYTETFTAPPYEGSTPA